MLRRCLTLFRSSKKTGRIDKAKNTVIYGLAGSRSSGAALAGGVPEAEAVVGVAGSEVSSASSTILANNLSVDFANPLLSTATPPLTPAHSSSHGTSDLERQATAPAVVVTSRIFPQRFLKLDDPREVEYLEKMALKDLPEHLNFPKMEEEVLAFWKEIDAFKTSLKKSEGRKPYTFYDGPPFATGLPHYGHILAGTIKDVVCRYAHQTGHHVERRFGWDCHGLPIEFEIEKELGIKSSHDVKKFGIDNYNNECRKIVMRYAQEWEVIVGRVGRWIDFENDYKTMNLSYMESVWWVFKQLWEKDLVYRGFKVMPFSTACTTPLSNFEANMNYKDVSDPSVIVSFPLVGDEETHLLAWTTTPWTLPSNLALCVNNGIDYVKVHDVKTNRNYILAECRLEEVYRNHAKAAEKPFTLIEKFKGTSLVGKRYVPMFPYFSEFKTAFCVVADNYVSTESGTGIVHNAPGFGEDDFRVCLANGILKKGEIVCPVDENGCFTDEVADFKGRNIKQCDDDIAAHIKAAGRLVSKASIVHSYPFCWRSETPLIYKAVDAWFVKVENIRDRLLAANEQTSWVPDFVKTKRFSNWLEDAKDWNISRNRYWGTPLPVWVSEDMEEVVCVGSVEELARLSGVENIDDIHREFVDKITIPSQREGKPPLRRIEQVFDCWFESGSMPYAQSHYPFEKKEAFESTFPADFIAEGLDQTRGWFYTLLVLSTALFDKPPYRNLIVNGLVLAEDGKKMSKRLKNYPEPTKVVDEHGADALRLYLINSPVVRAEPLRFREAGVKDVVKDVLLPFMNATKFFLNHAKHFLIENKMDVHLKSKNDMDRWILAATQTLVQYVHREMDGYRLYTVVPGVLRFVEKLTNWYVRMNRRRLKGAVSHEDWHGSLSTLFQVLFSVCRVLAPYTPFVAETIYQAIRGLVDEQLREDSVHYLMIPEVDTSLFDDALESSMDAMTTIVDLVRVLRDRVKITMKKPLRQVIICHPDPGYLKDLEPLGHYICDEVNCFDLKFAPDDGEYVLTKLDANMATLGKRLGKQGPQARKAIQAMSEVEVKSFLKAGSVTVGGFDITTDDVKIQRTFRPGIENFESNTDGNVVVLVDTVMDEAMVDSWKAREFVNRVQMLRKKAKLLITDLVDVYYHTADEELAGSLARCRDQISATVRGVWAPKDAMPAGAVKVAAEENEIAESSIEIVFTKPVKVHSDPAAQ